MDQGTFPSIWKTCSVTPILKSGDPALVSNYRPISILPHLAKIFECIIYNCIKRPLNHILIPQQHGFRPGKSTVTSGVYFSTFINDSFEMGQQVDVIFTDFSKAFDSVDHGLLINELESLGIGNPLLSWLRSYLSDRKQFVKIHNVCSDPIIVSSGVPQGGHLSPLLFNLFINSISNYVSNVKVLLYADDIKFFHRIKVSEDFCLLQDELNKFTDWASHLGLSLNLSKCHVITFSRSRTPILHNYSFNGTIS